MEGIEAVLLRHAARSANGEESWKMIHDRIRVATEI